MERHFGVALVFLAVIGLCLTAPVQAQSSAKIVFAEELQEQAQEQLLRLLSEYDLDPWIFTRKVKIVGGDIIPHSHPILTIDTEYLNDDARQLDIFIHEQIHWFGEAHEKAVEQAMAELRDRYPESPDPDSSPYLHLVVGWLEFDAMMQLVGEQKAREILSQKGHYEWIYDRVLEDTEEIGAILAKHGLLITPEKGLVADPNVE